jgi:hypothetical protein
MWASGLRKASRPMANNDPINPCQSALIAESVIEQLRQIQQNRVPAAQGLNYPTQYGLPLQPCPTCGSCPTCGRTARPLSYSNVTC